MSKWFRNRAGIHACFEEKIVRVKMDDAMLQLIKSNLFDVFKLAKSLKYKYESQFGTPLEIDETSLGIELWGHVVLNQIFEGLLKIPFCGSEKSPVARFAQKGLQHTAVIDCGEKSVDSNRFVWDGIQDFAEWISFRHK